MFAGPARQSRGAAFTLIELLVVIVVLGIVAGLGTGILVEGGRAYSRSNTQTDGLTDARHALDRLCGELSNLASATDISSISATSITFSLQGASRTFQKSGSSLVRGPNTLATDVSLFSLTYYDADGNTTLTPAQVRRIAAELAVTRDGITVRLRTEVTPRALRSNYVSWQDQPSG